MYITEPLCYIAEIGTTLSINHTSIKKIFSEERGEIYEQDCEVNSRSSILAVNQPLISV